MHGAPPWSIEFNQDDALPCPQKDHANAILLPRLLRVLRDSFNDVHNLIFSLGCNLNSLHLLIAP
jgi:hypothetical protein